MPTVYAAYGNKAGLTRALADAAELSADTTATDIYAALCNIDVYTALTDERGWSPDRVERWWA